MDTGGHGWTQTRTVAQAFQPEGGASGQKSVGGASGQKSVGGASAPRDPIPQPLAITKERRDAERPRPRRDAEHRDENTCGAQAFELVPLA